MSAHDALSPLEHFRSYLHLLAALRAEAEALPRARAPPRSAEKRFPDAGRGAYLPTSENRLRPAIQGSAGSAWFCLMRRIDC